MPHDVLDPRRVESESELVARAQSGDRAAFATIVRTYSPEIMRFLLSKLIRAADAQDLMQETFVRAMRHIGGYTHGGNLRGWLLAIAKNALVDAMRCQARHERHLDGEVEDLLDEAMQQSPAIDEVFIRDETLRCLKACIDCLGPEKFAAVQAWLRGGNLAEHARQTGVAESTVRMRWREAKKALQKCLSRGPGSQDGEGK
jgi:RNA polymerase sigma-70 factor, ECF subfamily